MKEVLRERQGDKLNTNYTTFLSYQFCKSISYSKKVLISWTICLLYYDTKVIDASEVGRRRHNHGQPLVDRTMTMTRGRLDDDEAVHQEGS